MSGDAKAKRTKRHPGCIEDRGHYLRVVLFVGGEKHHYRLESLERKAAERFAREKHRELQAEHDRRKRQPGAAVRVSDLIDRYRRDELPTLAPGTQGSYEDSLGPITTYFTTVLADPSIIDVAAKDIIGYLAWRRNQRRPGKGQKAVAAPLHNRTLQKDRAVLHRVFDFADRLELRDGNPVGRVKAPKADPRAPVILTDDEFEKLVAKCDGNPMLKLYALTLGETGGRAFAEVLHLRFQDVDLTDGWIEVRSVGKGHRTKSGKARVVPMTPRLRDAMKEHFARYRFAQYKGATTPWIFHHLIDRRGAKAGERVQSFRKAFDHAARLAGIPDTFHRHDLRHRRVTSWLGQGKSAVLVKEAMGHADLRTTMGYTHLSREHLKALVDDAGAVPRAIAPQEDAKGRKPNEVARPATA